ncbi:MAG: STAS domain-containing protein [Elainellaceae cyanobacterium]
MTIAYVFAPAYTSLGTDEAPGFLDWVDSRLKAGAGYLLVDLQNIQEIGSSGLGTLMIARNRARRAGATLMLCSLTPSTRLCLDRAGMLEKFKIYSDRQAFEQQMDAPTDLSLS